MRRRVHVVAAAVYATFLYVFSPMNLLFIGWFADFEDAISHRVHEVSIGALFTMGFAGVLAHIKRSERAAGSIQAVIALCIAAGVITTTTGFEPLVLAYLLPPLALIALDPQWRRTVKPVVRWDPRLAMLAWLLVVIDGPEILRNFLKAADRVQGHEAHWGAMAAFSIAIALLALVSSLRPPGWRLSAWSVVGVVTVNALVSMAFRFDASALGVGSALLALFWAAGFGLTTWLAAGDGSAVPLRRPDVGLVAGVATGLSDHFGWRVGLVRTLFAIPLLGSSLYLLLWVALPGADAAGRHRQIGSYLALGSVAFVGVSSLVLGSAFLALPVVLVLPAAFLVARALRRGGSGTRSWTRSLAGLAAGMGVISAFLGLAGLAIADDFGPPVVPHRIDSEATVYCSTCHGNEGVARGAPILKIFEHSGGSACVECHSHLPVADIPATATDALWQLPLGVARP